MFSAGLPEAAMFRPGTLMNRENPRTIEKILKWIPGPKTDAKVLAKAMFEHAVTEALKIRNNEGEWKAQTIIENDQIKIMGATDKV